jgi:hypothetical protein
MVFGNYKSKGRRGRVRDGRTGRKPARHTMVP